MPKRSRAWYELHRMRTTTRQKLRRYPMRMPNAPFTYRAMIEAVEEALDRKAQQAAGL